MIHVPLVVTAALLPFAGYPLLYLPVHVVWIELLIHPTALVVFQEVPVGRVLAPVARTARIQFFTAAQWLRIAVVGLLVTGVVLAGYLRSVGLGDAPGDGLAHEVEHGRAMALVALTAASAGITARLSGLRTRAAQGMVAATLLSALVLVQTPVLARLLHLAPLGLGDWSLSFGGAVLVTLLAARGRMRP
jgi:Ca2+-transporting ATPase